MKHTILQVFSSCYVKFVKIQKLNDKNFETEFKWFFFTHFDSFILKGSRPPWGEDNSWRARFNIGDFWIDIFCLAPWSKCVARFVHGTDHDHDGMNS